MMQRFTVLFLAVSFVLLGFVAPVPVEAALLVKRETNAVRFARGLPPLPPVRRTKTSAAKRAEPSQHFGATKVAKSSTGRLEIRWAANGTTAGYVANNPTTGPIGLNLNNDLELYVDYSDSNLLARDARFPAPYYVGGHGDSTLAAGSSNTIEFINVESGPTAAIWTLDSNTRALNATWTNSHGSKTQPSLAYDPSLNALNFTGDFTALSNLHNPPTQFLVHIYLSP
ncbi:hypothetical protein B0F90DRAFT_1739507 [Multifurca ochricompacta]|uniref:Uncharacterized protein n=1 Tax=Multifurca ochricompacta TaxID=376703 RepID=A0AAD4M056_9AGAM|nr:hypothetical protein B0F90DRAFT_1739507 [Multifurca ochricompacta]